MNSLKDLTNQEQKHLLDIAFGLDRLVILLLLETGLEIEDLIDLRVSDVDLEKGLLWASGKSIALSHETIVALKDYLKARPGQVYLLEGRCGKPITGKWKRCVLEKLIQMLGSRVKT